ncbi:ABC transporter substrate-binding protein [Bacillus salipaludis]|uniref:ABC transporter substrate-binding protein n=1 Tax=Bacillus salipaludis TaxID=2547811 RepID=A0ABW8RNX5_9BACI
MKRLISVLTSVILLVSLAACSSSTSTKEKKSSNKDIVEINFFHRWPNEPRKSFYDKKVKEYEAAHPNVKIKVNSVLNDSYKEKIRVLVSSDDLPDVFSSWSDSFAANLVSSDRIMPLNDILAEDKEWSGNIIESQFAGFTFDDKTYGVPFTVDGKAFFYNKEVFKKNNIEVPKTYSEFIDVLKKLQKAGYETPLVEGLTNGWAISHYMGTIFQRVVDPAVTAKDYNDKTAEFKDEGYVKGLEVFKELTKYMGDVSTAIDHEAARNMFASGEAPIVYMQFAEIKLVEDQSKLEFGFFDFPEIEGGKGDSNALTGAPEGWMLSKNAPKEAVDFLKFLTSKETAYEFTKTDGQLNAIKGAVDEGNTSPARLEAYQIVLNASKTTPWFDNAVNIKLADIFMRGGQSLANGQSKPKDVMKEVQEEAERLKK